MFLKSSPGATLRDVRLGNACIRNGPVVRRFENTIQTWRRQILFFLRLEKDASETGPHSATDNDYDHSFRRLPVHEALTCPEGQSAWEKAPLWLAKETRSRHK